MLAAVDWSRPWLQPYAALQQRAQAVLAAQPGAAVWQLLDALGDCGRRFVPQHELPEGEAYEHFVRRTRTVPTRDNLHDWFNGLVWQRFAQTKARLNALQAEAIARAGVGQHRGPLRDAITLLDENGAFLIASEPVWQALRERQWQRLFVELRPEWQQARLLLFGHALLEKLVQPRKPVTAHVICLPQPLRLVDNTDADVAGQLSAEHLADKPFVPLPVLGVPGWWKDNENFSFYDDSAVFRPARSPERR
ncbi:DUF3025 domain-containing protein [Comamonas humi]